MFRGLKLGIALVAIAAAGCAARPLAPSGAAGASARSVDAIPARTLAGEPVTSRHGGVVTGRDWNCPSCYK